MTCNPSRESVQMGTVFQEKVERMHPLRTTVSDRGDISVLQLPFYHKEPQAGVMHFLGTAVDLSALSQEHDDTAPDAAILEPDFSSNDVIRALEYP